MGDENRDGGGYRNGEELRGRSWHAHYLLSSGARSRHALANAMILRGLAQERRYLNTLGVGCFLVDEPGCGRINAHLGAA